MRVPGRHLLLMRADLGGGQLIVFMRWPKAGVTKTRLIPALGAEGASELHRRMAEHTVAVAREFCASRRATLSVCFTGAGVDMMQSWLGDGILFEPQSSGDLGDRLLQAFEAHCPSSDYVLVIGTDCPALSPDILEQAAVSLESHDVALGPARDGGYYLIGLKGAHASLFAGITWGGGDVYRDTLTAAVAAGLSVAKLPELSDVDRPEDLDACGVMFVNVSTFRVYECSGA